MKENSPTKNLKKITASTRHARRDADQRHPKKYKCEGKKYYSASPNGRGCLWMATEDKEEADAMRKKKIKTNTHREEYAKGKEKKRDRS